MRVINTKKPSMRFANGLASYMTSYLQAEHHNDIKKVMIDCGFVDVLSKNPLDKEDLKIAVLHAQEIKENFYTVLSEKDAMDKIIDFIENDELMKKMTQ